MQSHRKSRESALGDHTEKNPLRSTRLNTNIARKPTRTGNPSRNQRVAGEDEAQDLKLQGKNLQEESPAERARYSRTAELLSAPIVKRAAS